ncbi:MAG: hypothetical protein GX115_00315, partial [Ruminiclostridium sp.]|nr:hypothetical protein [Ruminiclostridium sp.]
EVPMIFIAGEISPIVQILYAIVLIAEIYTTAVGALFGFSSRMISMHRKPQTGKIVVVCTAAAALLASSLGFSNLVRYLYPLVGYCGIALLGALVVTTLKENKTVLM